MITAELKSNHTKSSGKSKLRGSLLKKRKTNKKPCFAHILKDKEKPTKGLFWIKEE